MINLFSNCESLEKIDIKHFDTSAVKSMASMFNNCKLLRNIDLKNFNTSKVESFSKMFDGCENLVEIDLTSFDAGKLLRTGRMFASCKNLTTIFTKDKTTWTLESKNSKDMFASCGKLLATNGSKMTKFDPAHTDGELARTCAVDRDGYFSVKSQTPAAPAKPTTPKASEIKNNTLPALKANNRNTDTDSGKKVDPSKLKVKKIKIKSLKNHRFKFSWKNNAYASGYKIMYKSKASGKFRLLKDIKKAGTVGKKLAKGRKYTFKICAYKVVDNKKVYGKWAMRKNILCR